MPGFGDNYRFDFSSPTGYRKEENKASFDYNPGRHNHYSYLQGNHEAGKAFNSAISDLNNAIHRVRVDYSSDNFNNYDSIKSMMHGEHNYLNMAMNNNNEDGYATTRLTEEEPFDVLYGSCRIRKVKANT